MQCVVSTTNPHIQKPFCSEFWNYFVNIPSVTAFMQTSTASEKHTNREDTEQLTTFLARIVEQSCSEIKHNLISHQRNMLMHKILDDMPPEPDPEMTFFRASFDVEAQENPVQEEDPDEGPKILIFGRDLLASVQDDTVSREEPFPRPVTAALNEAHGAVILGTKIYITADKISVQVFDIENGDKLHDIKIPPLSVKEHCTIVKPRVTLDHGRVYFFHGVSNDVYEIIDDSMVKVAVLPSHVRRMQVIEHTENVFEVFYSDCQRFTRYVKIVDQKVEKAEILETLRSTVSVVLGLQQKKRLFVQFCHDQLGIAVDGQLAYLAKGIACTPNMLTRRNRFYILRDRKVTIINSANDAVVNVELEKLAQFFIMKQ